MPPVKKARSNGSVPKVIGIAMKPCEHMAITTACTTLSHSPCTPIIRIEGNSITYVEGDRGGQVRWRWRWLVGWLVGTHPPTLASAEKRVKIELTINSQPMNHGGPGLGLYFDQSTMWPEAN